MPLEGNGDFGFFLFTPLPGPDSKRHVSPAVTIDCRPDSGKRFRRRIGIVYLFAVTLVLPANGLLFDTVSRYRDNLTEQCLAPGMDMLAVEHSRLVHRDDGQDLQQVALDEITQRADWLIKLGAALNANLLAGANFNTLHVLGVPQGFEYRVLEAKRQDILDGFLGQVVINTKNLVFAENSGRFFDE